jgi:hypothetical protein
MDVTRLRAIADALALTGCLGTVAMALYKAAMRCVDWDLIPASARSRVRWWSAHASSVLGASLFLVALGLTVLGWAGPAGG